LGDDYAKVDAAARPTPRRRREPLVGDEDPDVGLNVLDVADELVGLLHVDLARVVLTVDRPGHLVARGLREAALEHDIDLPVDPAELAAQLLVEGDLGIRRRPLGEFLEYVVLVVAPGEVSISHGCILGGSSYCDPRLPFASEGYRTQRSALLRGEVNL